MATKKVAKKPAAKKATKPAASKSVKSILSKSELASHLADASGVDGKSVKAVLAALEST